MSAAATPPWNNREGNQATILGWVVGLTLQSVMGAIAAARIMRAQKVVVVDTGVEPGATSFLAGFLSWKQALVLAGLRLSGGYDTTELHGAECIMVGACCAFVRSVTGRGGLRHLPPGSGVGASMVCVYCL